MMQKLTPEAKKCVILKTLLELDKASKQKLTNELPKDKKMARATVSKEVDNLVDEGLVKIEIGPRGPRGTHYSTLKFKGFVYLILKCNLADEQLEKTLKGLFGRHRFIFRRAIKSADFRVTLSQAVSESIQELRSKVNFEFFNEAWALNLFSDLVDEAFWKYHEKVRIHTPEELRKFLKRAGMSKNVAMKIYRSKRDYWRAQKKVAETKKRIYGKMVQLAEKMRY